MSATVEKATRRDLRRAVGLETVEIVEDLIRRSDAQAVTIQSHHEHTVMVRTIALKTSDDLRHFIDAGFVARLRWLLTGRLP